jgi:short-subunit dehydrogenase
MTNSIKSSALVLGAFGDVGLAFANMVVKNYSDVTLVYRSKPDPQLCIFDDSVRLIRLDYPLNCFEFESFLESRDAPFDFVVNCIGVYQETHNIYSRSDFGFSIENNFYILQYIMELLRSRFSRDATFVNVSSIASFIPSEHEMAYSGVKYLVDRFIEVLRSQDDMKNVRVLNVRPGAVISKMTKNRKDSDRFIDPNELVALVTNVLTFGNSLAVSDLNVYRRK